MSFDFLDFLSNIGSGASDLGGKAYDWLSSGLSNMPSQLMSADVLLPAALAAGGMYTQNRAISNATTKQQQEVDRGMQQQVAMQAPITQAIGNYASYVAPEATQARTAALGSGLENSAASFLDATNAKLPSVQTAGRVSNDFTTGSANMSAEEAARRASINKLWANTLAPGQEQFNTGLKLGELGSTIGGVQADANTLAKDNALAVEKAGQPNGAALVGGSLASNVGSALLGSKLSRGLPAKGVPFGGTAADPWYG